MKVALITDTHFGVRQDSPLFLDYQERFFKEIFFPKIDELGITTVIHLGDVVDRRKYINFLTLKRMRNMYFDPLKERNIWSPTILGNHDAHFKNTNEVNSLELLLQDYPNLTIVREPNVHYVHETPILMVPWICPENEAACFDALANARTDLCMGHFALNGFVMHVGQVAETGLDRKIFDRFDLVFSGHYHHRSSDGRIWYLGNPGEMTWQDFNDPKGFHILDLDTRTLTFVRNPYRMFHRIVYNEETFYDTMLDYNDYTNSYVKIVVEKKTDIAMWDKFTKDLFNANPFSVSVVQNYADVFETPEEFVPDQGDTTLTMLRRFVDEGEIGKNYDKDTLKLLLTEIYQEAVNVEV